MKTLLLLALLALPALAADLTLTWSDNSMNETGFAIERAPTPATATAPTTWTEIARVPANTTTYRDTGLPEGTLFWYRIRAFNTAGSSAYSNTASASTAALPPPIAPTTLKVVPVPIPPQ
jgi:hypothetical protein